MIQRLLHFLDASPVNFLAVRNITHELETHGFRRIDAASPLGHVSAGDRFFVTKNDSSIYAFRIGRKPLADQGFHMICAHSDSPTFRIKPNAEMTGEGGIVRLNTEVYGGPILSTWMDRPLTIAGRVITRDEDALSPVTHLIHIRRPLMQISNLAIHFNRQVNDGVKLNRQKDMLPILGFVNDELERGNMLINLVVEELNRTATVTRDDIIDFDLYLADTTPACAFGAHDELISSGRLDDLSMCYAGLEALTAAHDSDTTQVLAIFDNEETGSQTKQGAGSPFLSYLLQRIALAQSGTAEAYYQAVERAFIISADNAHAFHPNYAEKYDPTNHPMLGGGPGHQVQCRPEVCQRRRHSGSLCRAVPQGGCALPALCQPQRGGGRKHVGQHPRPRRYPCEGLTWATPFWPCTAAARREAWPTTSIASRYSPLSTTNNPSSCTTISLSLPSSAHV